jgi:hypothetical protein
MAFVLIPSAINFAVFELTYCRKGENTSVFQHLWIDRGKCLKDCDRDDGCLYYVLSSFKNRMLRVWQQERRKSGNDGKESRLASRIPIVEERHMWFLNRFINFIQWNTIWFLFDLALHHCAIKWKTQFVQMVPLDVPTHKTTVSIIN